MPLLDGRVLRVLNSVACVEKFCHVKPGCIHISGSRREARLEDCVGVYLTTEHNRFLTAAHNMKRAIAHYRPGLVAITPQYCLQGNKDMYFGSLSAMDVRHPDGVV